MHLLKTCLPVAVAAFLFAACATPAPAATAADAPPVPLLWKVSDADNALYLLGSFHLLKPGDYPLSDDVEVALADAETLLFEISPEEMGSPALGAAMAQAAMRTDDTRLGDELTPEVAARLDAWLAANAASLQKMGMAPEALRIFEPWFAGLMISIVEMTNLGLDPELGLDMHLAEAARKADKPTAGLETGVQQIALFDGMGTQEQLQLLEEALGDAAESRRQIEQLHAAWRAGDVETLWTGMAADMRLEYPQLYRRINVERNDAWVPTLEARLGQPGDDDTLVVVGALHLLGDDGVVEKLRTLGYTVERICSACAGLPAANP